LRDRVYIVTGGSRGLGFAAAQALVAEGARVCSALRTRPRPPRPVARLTGEASAGAATAWRPTNADPATPGRLIAAARDGFGRLDGALFSVGGTPAGTVATTPDEAWRSGFESVFLGAVRLARALAADLAAAGLRARSRGPVAPWSSCWPRRLRVPLPGLAISNGLFPGLAGVVKTMADEIGPSGLRINGVLPVRIAPTGFRELDALSGDPDEVRARLSQRIPLRGTASQRSSGAWPRSCSPRPLPTSLAR